MRFNRKVLPKQPFRKSEWKIDYFQGHIFSTPRAASKEWIRGIIHHSCRKRYVRSCANDALRRAYDKLSETAGYMGRTPISIFIH